MNKVIKIIKIMSVIALVLTAGVAINRLFTGAEQIIRHWNFEGTVDGYAPKAFILLIPLLSIFLFFIRFSFFFWRFFFFGWKKLLVL